MQSCVWIVWNNVDKLCCDRVLSVSSLVPELLARGVIHQMFPLHEQRILKQLMTSWVQAVCERQPLGQEKSDRMVNSTVLSSLQATMMVKYSDFVCVVDDICDYFGVKISMYFAWLGFYTNSMLYPAVIGFLLWILAESDQVLVAAVHCLSFQTQIKV